MDKKYKSLLDTYRRIFSMVDAFHFNSQNTADVYGKYISIPEASKVIPISHGGITDCRKSKSFDEKVLRLGFIGSEAPYKGLFMLKEVLTRIWLLLSAFLCGDRFSRRNGSLTGDSGISGFL